MPPLVEPGPGCALVVEEMAVIAVGSDWLESTHLEVAGAPGCPWVDVALPANAALVSWTGRSKLGDGRSQRLGEERFERRVRDVNGVGALRVYLPELIQGDQAILEVSRRWTDGFSWEPATHGARFAQLTGTPLAVTGLTPDGDSWWAAPPPAGSRATFGVPPTGEAIATAAAPREDRSIRLQVPPGNPQLTLYPGGGSSTRTELQLTFEAEARDRAWVIPFRPEYDALTWSARPERSARVTQRDDSLLIELASSEAGATVALGWRAPDAATFGEGDSSLRVAGDGAEIQWESVGARRAWWLASWQEARVLPDRAAYVKALNRRFEIQNIPGVALPTELRGRLPDAAFAEDALATLRSRAGIGRWPQQATWPRKLIRARRSLAYTETEATLVLVGWLRQGGLQADWALAYPAMRGPGWTVSPAGYDRPLVVVSLPDGPRWMDPGCAECGPWEIRTTSAGSCLGPAGLDPPMPTGRWEVAVGGGEVRWTLAGAAALALREWLAELPPADREYRLASRLTGGSELIAVEGLAEAGAPIAIRATTTTTEEDPINSRELGWIGTRALSSPAMVAQPELAWNGDGLHWRRTTTNGVTTEEVIVEHLGIAHGAWDELARVRISPSQQPLIDDPALQPVPGGGLVIP